MHGWILIAALGLAVGASSYADLSSSAKVVRNLGRLLEAYLEDCDADVPGFDRDGCRARVRTARADPASRRLVVEVQNVQGRLSFAGWDKRRSAYRLHLVPIFGERGLAMSVGKPKRLDARGQPVLKNIPIWVKLPDGEPEFIFKKRLERGMVRLELVVEPVGAWRMRRKGEDDLRGMQTKLIALRLSAARGGAVLTEQTYERR